MKRGFKAQAERDALKIRQELNLQPWERLPAARLASKLDVCVIDPTKIRGLSSKHLQILTSDRQKEWSAVSLQDEQGVHVVIENSAHLVNRREASLFHELSHILLKHKPAGFQKMGDSGLLTRSFDEEQEEEANYLAGCLHLPKPLLCNCLRKSLTTEQISALSFASPQLISMRMNMSGAKKIYQRKAAWASTN